MDLLPIPNTAEGVSRRIVRRVELPPCCPVSKNPKPGSYILICYAPAKWELEVKHIIGYIHSYKNGRRDEAGNIIVRDMEGMLSQIAQDCANALQVEVKLVAKLDLHPIQSMSGVFTAKPA